MAMTMVTMLTNGDVVHVDDDVVVDDEDGDDDDYDDEDYADDDVVDSDHDQLTFVILHIHQTEPAE